MNMSKDHIEAARARYVALSDERLAEEVATLELHLRKLDPEKGPSQRPLHTASTIALEGCRAEQKRRTS